MREPEPQAGDAPNDSLQIEVYDLRHPDAPAQAWAAGDARSVSGAHRPRAGALPRARFTASAAALVLVLALVTLAPVRDTVTNVFAPPPPTPGGSIAASKTYLLWQTLRQRPLKLPTLTPGAPCPVTPTQRFSPEFGLGQGNGQVYALMAGDTSGTMRYTLVPPQNDVPLRYGQAEVSASAYLTAWGAASVAWVISLDYGGPVLVRGRQVDGHNPLRFNGGLSQPGSLSNPSTAPLLTELALLPTYGLDGVPWSAKIAYTRVRAPGCYAYQVDGLSFSAAIVFRAEPGAPDSSVP